MAYQVPEGALDWLSADGQTSLESALELRGSLPYLRRGLDLSGYSEKQLHTLAVALDELQVAEARRSPAAFVQYAFRHEETNAPIVNAPHHLAWHEFLDSKRRAILFAPVEHAKAVPLDTEIPTPSGWTTMGDLRDGDTVFGRDGKPYPVLKAHPVLIGQRVYEVRFRDGGRHRACEDHLWVAWTQYDRDEKRPPRVVPTRAFAEQIRHRSGYRWKVPVAEPVQYLEREFAIHPYVLGVWLGNGDSRTAMVTMHVADMEVIDRCVELDNGLRGATKRDPRSRAVRVNIGGDASSKKGDNTLRSRLRALGLLRNKHIPDTYLKASEEQRRELLAGLIDTDGTINAGSNARITFTQSDERMGRQVHQLVASLGYRPSLICNPVPGHKDSWAVAFVARDPVFRLRRKLARQNLDGDRARIDARSVVACDEVESVPVRCITVGSPDGTFLMGRDYTVTHNTQHAAIGRVVWEVCTSPSKRIAIVSNTAEPHAVKILSSIRAHIANNPRVARVFPDAKPSDKAGDPWGQSQITVERGTIAKDPSVQSLGVYGPINGSRLDGIILDDILNFENTRTPEQIQKVCDWLDSEVLTRVTPNGWIHWIGTPWNPADPMHKFAERAGWSSQSWCAVRNPDAPMEEWEPLWPEQFSRDRLIEIYHGTTPINFARKYLCRVRMDSASRFQQAWIDKAKELGRIYTMTDRQPHGLSGKPWACFTGVDLGVGQKEGHDLTVLFTVALDERMRKVVCEIQAGRWTAPDIVQRIHSCAYRFNSQILVENNQGQDFIVQWAGNDGLPVLGFTTTAGKKFDEHFGIESLAVEMRNGGWVIPSRGGVDPEVEAWIQEMLFYSPEAHTGDRLMASWFARECARQAGATIFRQMDTIAR